MTERRLSQAGWQHSWAEVDGLQMHSRTATTPGAENPVVLLHGLLVSSRYMAPLARALNPLGTVFAPDMPGFGRSDDPPEALDVEGLSHWLGRWLETHDLKDVLLVANSFGCQYAARYVAENPHRIRSLGLLGPTVDAAHRNAAGQAGRFVANAPLEPPTLGLVVARDLWDCGIPRVISTYRHALRHQIESDLVRISVETLVVRGERDLLVPQRWAEQVTALLPQGHLKVIPRAAHTINFNSAEMTAKALSPLLQKQ